MKIIFSIIEYNLFFFSVNKTILKSILSFSPRLISTMHQPANPHLSVRHQVQRHMGIAPCDIKIKQRISFPVSSPGAKQTLHGIHHGTAIHGPPPLSLNSFQLSSPHHSPGAYYPVPLLVVVQIMGQHINSE